MEAMRHIFYCKTRIKNSTEFLGCILLHKKSWDRNDGKKNPTKSMLKWTRYRLTHGIPWSVCSCGTGWCIFSPEQQFNGIASTVATLFALLVFCTFRKRSFSSPHSSTLRSRIFLFVLCTVFLKAGNRHTQGLIDNISWSVQIFFNQLTNVNVLFGIMTRA